LLIQVEVYRALLVDLLGCDIVCVLGGAGGLGGLILKFGGEGEEVDAFDRTREGPGEPETFLLLVSARAGREVDDTVGVGVEGDGEDLGVI
jgi:hypothetical protein